jgi:hypothetical protein
MPLTEKQKEQNALRRKEREQYKEDLTKWQIVDETSNGERCNAEVLPYVDLFNLYHGINPRFMMTEDDKKKGKKKSDVKPISAEILGESPDFIRWLQLRDTCRKQLFWFGQQVLKRDLLPHVHQAVCDQFVVKNFDHCFPAGYTLKTVHDAIDKQVRVDENGVDTKEMMLLDPRGFYKSTINQIDCVQWMICVPDIRILILTAEYKLALSFMKEIKDYFYLADGAEPSDFQLLFPEYILTGVDGTSKEPIDCPARRHPQRFPSMWVNSIDANLSGWHCDVRKGDDVVNDTNCNNDPTREALKQKFDGTTNLLDEWGFTDYIGTRYFVDDYYGTRLRPDPETNELDPIKYFCRQCWTVKPEYVDVPLKQLTRDMVVLTFKEKASFSSLRKKLLQNERSFRNQQLNEPTEAGEDSAYRATFSEDVLRAHIYQLMASPKQGDIYVSWDWAPSASKYSDMSVGAACRVYSRIDELTNETVWCLSILEIIYGRWRPTELAYQIVALNKKWNPKQTLIEKSPGAELLQLEITRQAMKYGTTLNIYWKPLTLTADAKRNRIKSLETLLADNRLYFVAGQWIDETFSQLLKYTGERKNRGRKDDIPDCLSFLTYFLPSTINNVEMRAMAEVQRKISEQKANYERIFGGAQQPMMPEPETVSSDPRGKFGIPGLRF